MVLQRLLFGYHLDTGYGLLTHSPDFPEDIIELIRNKFDRYYFGSQIKEDQPKSYKIRYIPIGYHQFLFGFVNAGLTPRGGATSFVEFYFLDKNQFHLFSTIFDSNPCLVLSNIERLDHNKILSNRTAITPAQTVFPESIDIEAYHDALRKKLDNMQFSYLLSRKVLLALECRKQVFIWSRQFNDSIDLFSTYCRGFIASLPKCFREAYSFSTGESSIEVSDYDVIFMLGESGIPAEAIPPNSCLINLDNPERDEQLWYCRDKEIFIQSMDFISDRLSLPSIGGLAFLKEYYNAVRNPHDKTDIVWILNAFLSISQHIEKIKVEKIMCDLAEIIEGRLSILKREEIERCIRPIQYWFELSKQISFSPEFKKRFITISLEWIIAVRISHSCYFEKCLNDLDSCEPGIISQILLALLQKTSGLNHLQPANLFKSPRDIINILDRLIKTAPADLSSEKANLYWNILKCVLNECEENPSTALAISNLLIEICIKILSISSEPYRNQLATEMLLSFNRAHLESSVGQLIIRIFFSQLKGVTFTEKIADFLKYYLSETSLNEIIDFATKLASQADKLSDTFIATCMREIFRSPKVLISEKLLFIKLFIFSGDRRDIINSTRVRLLSIIDEAIQTLSSSSNSNISGTHDIVKPFIVAIEIQQEFQNAHNRDRTCTKFIQDGHYIQIILPKFQATVNSTEVNYLIRPFLDSCVGYMQTNSIPFLLVPIFWTYLQNFRYMSTEKYFKALIDFINKLAISRNEDVFSLLSNLSSELSDIPIVHRDRDAHKLFKIDYKEILAQISLSSNDNLTNIDYLIAKILNNRRIPRSKLLNYFKYFTKNYMELFSERSKQIWREEIVHTEESM